MSESASIHRAKEKTVKVNPTFAPPLHNILFGIIYISIAILVAIHLPPGTFDPESQIFIFVIGAIGIWRYSWWLIHLVRSVIYRIHTFPNIKRKALHNNHTPKEIFILVTSYRIDPIHTCQVYSSIIENCISCNIPTTIYASVSDRSDVDILSNIIEQSNPPSWLKIRYMFQRGDGKRSAMAEVLRAISRTIPQKDSLVVFMDGDILLTPNTLNRSIPYFHDPQLGALTVNNRAIVDGGPVTREWYDLRYAQRHMLMCSMALSERVLVLTGRYSVIRGDLATDRSFIEQIEADYVDHWRFGRLQFLSGDDKSTWYWLLRRGWKMLYLPDVEVHGFEKLPEPRRFVASSTSLMRRWYGNMLRTNGRAIALGPRPMGLFIWWCIVDQRLSVWTGLIGPTVAILLTIFIRPSFLLFYVFWVMMTRLTASLILGAQRGRMSFYWPVLLYYGQVVGALIKGYVSFRRNQQSWTRQGITAGHASAPSGRNWPHRVSLILHCGGLAAFVYGALLLLQILPAPLDRSAMASMSFETESGLNDDWWIAPIIRRSGRGASIELANDTLHIGQITLDAIAFTGTAAFVGQGRDSVVDMSASSAPSPEEPGGEVVRQYCEHGTQSCRIALGDNSVVTVINATLISAPSTVDQLP
ncbi:glycosyltransferase [Fodinicurvata sp. EGI_FJ10296]|uniref:glycosyltransferase n=1 Tax=Fodinicurvata sp. EGI_FJ10296 TaxID=3231908 RepID=UPI003456509F